MLMLGVLNIHTQVYRRRPEPWVAKLQSLRTESPKQSSLLTPTSPLNTAGLGVLKATPRFANGINLRGLPELTEGNYTCGYSLWQRIHVRTCWRESHIGKSLGGFQRQSFQCPQEVFKSWHCCLTIHREDYKPGVFTRALMCRGFTGVHYRGMFDDWLPLWLNLVSILPTPKLDWNHVAQGLTLNIKDTSINCCYCCCCCC